MGLEQAWSGLPCNHHIPVSISTTILPVDKLCILRDPRFTYDGRWFVCDPSRQAIACAKSKNPWPNDPKWRPLKRK